MQLRICDACGIKKQVYGGKTCEKGHFICSGCNRHYTKCPLCTQPLK